MGNLMNVEIEDTYAEAFDGILSRVIVTSDYQSVLHKAAQDATATPSIVIGRIEGGIEKFLTKYETPNKRKGAILQFWGGIDENKPLLSSVKKFEAELSFKIRQDILVKPFTAVFDALPSPEGKFDVMERIGHCGDGYEWTEKRYGRTMISVPLMVSNFLIEKELGYKTAIMGANFWFMCKTKKAVIYAGKKALDSIHKVSGAVTPFDICSAGSKPETNFPLIGPTTNHLYCQSLKEKLGTKSKVQNGVKYIPEIVINGISLQVVKEAMKAGIQSIKEVDGIVRISAGNYGGKLGKHKIYLKELF
jgi:formylmethanofuran--tetrahydromethanopterin N-formyltransferase